MRFPLLFAAGGLLALAAQAQSTPPLHLAAYAAAHPGDTAYVQDFDALAEGLPEGWYVTFEAKPGQFGGPPDPRRVKLTPSDDPDPMKNTAWSGLDQVFRNFAARSLFLESGGLASLTEQAEAADRALGVRTGNALGESYLPVGGYDSGGAAFGFNLDSTGRRLTSVSFSLNLFGSLDANGKGYVIDWMLQASNSVAGDGWVDVGAVSTFGDAPVAGDVRHVTFSFRDRALFDRLTGAGLKLDDTPLLCFRLVATGKHTAAAGSAASERHSYALDNFTVGFTSLDDTAFDAPTNVYVPQLTLPAGRYDQDFSIIDDSALPSGWHVTRTATATSLGTFLTLASVESRNGTLADNLAYRVAWTNSNGTFKNFANPGTALKGPWLNDQAQEAFPNRMLGFRASSATGDLGHAFVFWCDATKCANLRLKLTVFATNASERPLEVSVECSADGTAWTTLQLLSGLGRVPTVEAGGMRMAYPLDLAVPASFNLSPSLYFRIAALALSPGGNPGSDLTRTAIAIDDFSLTYDVRP